MANQVDYNKLLKKAQKNNKKVHEYCDKCTKVERLVDRLNKMIKGGK